MSLQTRLLFVHEERDIRHHFCENLCAEDFLLKTVPDSREALKVLKIFPADIVMLCIVGDGLALLDEIRTHIPDGIIVAVVNNDTSKEVLNAVKLGGYNYVLMPFDFGAIRELIRNRLLKTSFEGKERRKRYRFENLIGRNIKMLDVYQKVNDVAVANTTVLITGETGTGKELVAEAIHSRSARKSGPLIRVNCAAFTETLINSELFGYEKGAFSGAMALKKGCFELADNGTILLDEIGDIPLQTQTCLLRLLDSGSFQRVGGVKTLKTNSRIICATNLDLWHMVQEKLFREDLFYRINVVSIHMPPLRERKSDIPLLARYFLKKYCGQIGKDISHIPDSTMEMLHRYDWPGNVRELANVIEQAVVFCKRKELALHNLPLKVRETSLPKAFILNLASRSLPDAASALIQNVLAETGWNMKQAAEKLDIARGTLYSKIKKYGIEKPRSGD
ncbi:sigma-54-dependent transcriptional regulator [Desulfotalea psychrophila]|uniref:sigma-54-dependent transcriptional regulator n=1 Tax=Desulfotalea psychrophila TaxID=84980 RepID=UPI0012EAFDC7|nr:sigma-54 dependent transcriptional regulator [Desulfotalea psychrophila]